MAQAPLDRPLARPTDALPIAHDRDVADGGPGAADAPAAAHQAACADDVPRHVAIIMDGNRRWARTRGLPEHEGHSAGVESVRAVLRHAVQRRVPVLTLYAFSRENWARSDDEIQWLFMLLEQAIRNETGELCDQGVRVRLLGRLDELPAETRASIAEALEATAGGTRLQLNIAFNYAGRTELVDAVRGLIAAGVAPEDVDERAISAALYTSGLPDPDLVIRTGDEQRISNFLLWQSAYAELWFTDVLWPDFGPDAFDAALREFARRTRRFGR